MKKLLIEFWIDVALSISKHSEDEISYFLFMHMNTTSSDVWQPSIWSYSWKKMQV